MGKIWRFFLKQKIYGIEANYWKITEYNYNAETNKTSVNLSLYFSEEARLENKDNFLTVIHFYFDGEIQRKDIYGKIKESKLEEIEYPESVNEETGEKIPAVKECKETNKFVNAIDC